MKKTRKESAQEIINLMMDGNSFRSACRQTGLAMSTFLGWVEADPKLAEQYAHARAILLEHLSEDLQEIADAPVGSTITGATDAGAVAKQRLQVDTRKWLLSKLAPKKYGDKMQLSGDAENPIAIQKIERVIVDK